MAIAAEPDSREEAPAPAAVVPARAADDKRLLYIDSLRAIAAILVVWQHTSEVFYRVGPAAQRSRWLHEWANSIGAGAIGVVAFFAISGFVIPFSIKLSHGYPVREFLVKRFFRLYPAYWLSIPIGMLCLWLWNVPLTFREALVNVTMLEYLFDVRPAIGLYWTLAIEFVFYVLCALLVLGGNIVKYRRVAALSCALILVHVGAYVASKVGYPTISLTKSAWFLQLGIMFWGTLYRAGQRSDLDRVGTALMWGIAAFIIIVYPVSFAYMLAVPFQQPMVYSLGLTLFIVGTRFVRISFWPMPWLGAISFSIYLFHAIVLSLVYKWLTLLPADSWWRSWHLGAYLALILSLTIIVAAVVYRFVEKPSIRLGHRLSQRWFADAPQPIAPVADLPIAALRAP